MSPVIENENIAVFQQVWVMLLSENSWAATFARDFRLIKKEELPEPLPFFLDVEGFGGFLFFLHGGVGPRFGFGLRIYGHEFEQGEFQVLSSSVLMYVSLIFGG